MFIINIQHTQRHGFLFHLITNGFYGICNFPIKSEKLQTQLDSV